MNLRIMSSKDALYGRCLVRLEYYPYSIPLTWNNKHYKIHRISPGDVVSLTDLASPEK